MELTLNNSAALIAVLLLNLFLVLLILVLILKIHNKRKQHKKEEEEEEIEEEEELEEVKAHSNAPQQNQKETEEQEQVTEGPPLPKEEEKKRKKRVRKKKHEGPSSSSSEVDLKDDGGKKKNPFPFSSFESAMQKRIQVKYDDLVASHRANRLTSVQVSEFIDCLIEARNELQHKSELIQRSFRIKKALLSKANKASFDRLYNQVYKLDYEHKKLQKDAAVYNVLQEQLKLSPAYKTMLEISNKMKSEENEEQNVDFSEISFEELLAQEKKDSFWQKNGKMRSFAN